MVQSAHAETEAPDLTPDQLSSLNGGYEYGTDEYVPGEADVHTGANESEADIEAAIDKVTTDTRVRDRFLALLERAKENAARTGGAIAGATLIAILLAACGPTGEPTVTATSTPTSIDNETPTPAPTETEKPEAGNPFVGELAITPEQIAEYKAMDLKTEFWQLSPKERTGYFLSLASDPEKGLAAYAEFYTYISGNPADALPETISVDNTPEEIIKIAAYGQRFAASFDLPEAQKVLAGTVNDLNTTSYSHINDWVGQNAPVTSRVMGAWSTEGKGIAAGTVVSAGERLQPTPSSDVTIVIVVQGPDGKKASIPYTFVTNGTMGMWEPGAVTEVQ
jgi:hypothetical protein